MCGCVSVRVCVCPCVCPCVCVCVCLSFCLYVCLSPHPSHLHIFFICQLINQASLISSTLTLGAKCRGLGAIERDAEGKERGAKAPFLPVRRPKILNLRCVSGPCLPWLSVLSNSCATAERQQDRDLSHTRQSYYVCLSWLPVLSDSREEISMLQPYFKCLS